MCTCTLAATLCCPSCTYGGEIGSQTNCRGGKMIFPLPLGRAAGAQSWSGAVAAAVRCWSNFEEIPHVQGQRRSPRKMVGGVKSCLESNHIPARDAQRVQTCLVCTRTQRPHRDWDRTVFGCLLRRYGSAVSCYRGRGSGCSRPGYGISLLGGCN